MSGYAWPRRDRHQRIGRGTATQRLNVPATLSVFETHFPRFPVVPGVLLLQALTDLAVRYVGDTESGAWDLAGFQDVRFRRPVRPGDQVDLSVVVEPSTSESKVFSGSARVDTVVVVSARRILLRGRAGA